MDADIIAALNGLLEEERADTEALVGLVAMATDTIERQALTTMGGQAAQGCIDLHARLARLGAPISGRVSHSVVRVLQHEHFDDRLRAFGEVQRYLAGRCAALQTRNLDDETRELLGALSEVQLVHASWAEQRADEFAASRPSDVESSSPSHSVPRGERPLDSAAATGAPTGATVAPSMDVPADTPHAYDVLPPDPREGSEEMEAIPTVDEPASVEPASHAPEGLAVEPAPVGPPVDAAGEAPAASAPKPRVRRARASAPPVGRRAPKRP